MHRFGTTLMICFMFSLSGIPALAQPETREWKFDITPRFWYMMANPDPFSDSTFIQQTNETATFPLYGFSLRVEPPGRSDFDLLLTAFRGSDTVHGRSVTVLGSSSQHTTEATRTDVELLYRNRIADSNAHWFVGVRWVLFEEDSTIVTTSGPPIFFPASTTNLLEEETNFYLAEVGFSFAMPIDAEGRHTLFGNFTGGFGYEVNKVENRMSPARPDEEGFIPFIDANVGYQYSFTDNFSVHVRYRSYVLRELVRDDIFALHGPEVGLTIRF